MLTPQNLATLSAILWLDSGEGVKSRDLFKELGISRHLLYSRAKKLLKAGLIERSPSKGGGEPGRPCLVYRLTEQGFQALEGLS